MKKATGEKPDTMEAVNTWKGINMRIYGHIDSKSVFAQFWHVFRWSVTVTAKL